MLYHVFKAGDFLLKVSKLLANKITINGELTSYFFCGSEREKSLVDLLLIATNKLDRQIRIDRITLIFKKGSNELVLFFDKKISLTPKETYERNVMIDVPKDQVTKFSTMRIVLREVGTGTSYRSKELTFTIPE